MVTIKSKEEIEKMRQASLVVAETLLMISEKVKPGISTYDLDRQAESYIVSKGMKPAFKGYMGFQHTLCTSINHEIVHGIPSKSRILEEGDILSVDCGAIFEGYFGDSARTFACGKVSSEAERLLNATWQSLNAGIEKMIPNNRLYDIGAAVQACAESQNMGVVKEYVGHGIGTKLHEEPQVPNYGKAGTGMRLKCGMVFAVEPMLNLGTAETKLLKDGWTVVTKDGSLSAHFEDTIVISENGPEILTRI